MKSPYALALFELAQEVSAEEEILAEITLIRRCLSENPEYLRLLDAANIDFEIKGQLIDEAFQNAHRYIRNILKILAERRKAALFLSVAEEYARLYRQNRGIVQAKLILPCEMPNDILQRFEKRLCEKSGKVVRMQVEIDPKLIGGLRLEMNGRQYDNSLQGALKRILENQTEDLRICGSEPRKLRS